MDYARRQSAMQAQVEKLHLDALLVTHLPNIRYLCGFTGSAGVLSLGLGRAAFFTDGRYTAQAREELPARAWSFAMDRRCWRRRSLPGRAGCGAWALKPRT